MTSMKPGTFEAFEDRSPVRDTLPYAIGLLILAGLVWFVYTQITAVGGIRVDNERKSIVDIIPLPPPPPPPPPPEVKEKPPEPTEQPQPAPSNDQPKAAKPEAAPVQMNAPAQAGEGPIASGSGQGRGSPSSTGTCLVNCGSAPSGGGMTEGLYRQYLSSALEERVRGDDKLSRLVFSADLTLTVTPDGRVTGVRLLGARGRNDEESMRKLAALLSEVRGLNAPPSSMVFPQRVTVRGRRGI